MPVTVEEAYADNKPGPTFTHQGDVFTSIQTGGPSFYRYLRYCRLIRWCSVAPDREVKFLNVSFGHLCTEARFVREKDRKVVERAWKLRHEKPIAADVHRIVEFGDEFLSREAVTMGVVLANGEKIGPFRAYGQKAISYRRLRRLTDGYQPEDDEARKRKRKQHERLLREGTEPQKAKAREALAALDKVKELLPSVRVIERVVEGVSGWPRSFIHMGDLRRETEHERSPEKIRAEASTRTEAKLRTLSHDELVNRREAKWLGFGRGLWHTYCLPSSPPHPALLEIVSASVDSNAPRDKWLRDIADKYGCSKGQILIDKGEFKDTMGRLIHAPGARIGDLLAIEEWFKTWRQPPGMIHIAAAADLAQCTRTFLQKAIPEGSGSRELLWAPTPLPPSRPQGKHRLPMLWRQCFVSREKVEEVISHSGKPVKIVWVKDVDGVVRDYYLNREAREIVGLTSLHAGVKVHTLLCRVPVLRHGLKPGDVYQIFRGDDLRAEYAKRTGETMEAQTSTRAQQESALVSDGTYARKPAPDEPASAPAPAKGRTVTTARKRPAKSSAGGRPQIDEDSPEAKFYYFVDQDYKRQHADTGITKAQYGAETRDLDGTFLGKAGVRRIQAWVALHPPSKNPVKKPGQ